MFAPAAVMLSPKDLAQVIGVSESSLKRWADDGLLAVSRTAGGHRRIPLPEAIRFIRQTGVAVVRPDLLGVPGLDALPESDTDNIGASDEPIHDALLSGDGQRVRALLIAMFLQGTPIAALCDGPLRSAMTRIGELWAHDSRGIAVEHVATELCIQAVNHLRLLLPVRGHDAPIALGAAFEGDPYTLPSLMAAAAVAEVGFRDINLGGNTPVGVIAQAALDHGARLVWVSISGSADPAIARAGIQNIADVVAPSGAQVVIGGRSLQPGILPRRANIHTASSMSEFAAFARGMLLSAPVSGVVSAPAERRSARLPRRLGG